MAVGKRNIYDISPASRPGFLNVRFKLCDLKTKRNRAFYPVTT
jgi:hypothetical protein